MKTRNLMMMMMMAALAMCPSVSSAQTTPQCGGIQLFATAMALTPTTLYNVTDFSGSMGQLDPTPIAEARIQVLEIVPRLPQCVTVTFSTVAAPQDNSIVFQASIDDIPMNGHGASVYPTPIVWDPEETDKNLPRMLSYTFFASLAPGAHTVRIKVASCCTSNPTGTVVINAGTVVVRY
jgi:hypothetical protein